MEENKKKKRTAGDVIRMLIMIVALGVFCYSGYQLLSIYQEYKKGSDEYHALENKYIDEKGMFEEINTDAAEPTMKNPIDFAGLKAVNEDIIAWLKVGAIDTVIRSRRARITITICTIPLKISRILPDVFLWITAAKKIFPIRTRSFTDTICEIFPCSEN